MQLDFAKLDGLVPAIVQDAATGEVLMLGFMNEAGLCGDASLGRGHVLQPHARTNCGARASRAATRCGSAKCAWIATTMRCCVRVDAVGPGVCHEGYRSCFFRRLEATARRASWPSEPSIRRPSTARREGRANEAAATGPAQGKPAGRHAATFCARRLAHHRRIRAAISRRSTIRRSPACWCARRRWRATSKPARWTPASPAATGCSRPAPTWSRSPNCSTPSRAWRRCAGCWRCPRKRRCNRRAISKGR